MPLALGPLKRTGGLKLQMSGTLASLFTGAPAYPAGTFVSDDFTDTDGTTVDAHQAPIGGPWQMLTGAASINSGRVYQTSVGTAAVYQAAATPPNADQEVTATFDKLTTMAGEIAAVQLRQTATNTNYVARWANDAGQWQILRSGTLIGSPYSDTWADGQSRTVKFIAVGSILLLYVNGVLRIVVSDATISAVGKVGFRHTGTQTGATGVQLTNFTAATAAALTSFDTFTDTDGVLLQAHAGEIGAAWTAYGANLTVAANRIYQAGGGTAVYAASGAIGPDQEAEADFYKFSSIVGDQPSLAVRVTSSSSLYYARWVETSQVWQIVSQSGGQISANVIDTWADGETKSVKLRVIGPTLFLFVNGALVRQVTDPAPLTGGQPGLRRSGLQTTTTGIHVNTFMARAA